MADYPKQIHSSAKQFRLTLSLVKPSRIEQRRQVAETWLQEDENSKYRYDVEKCQDGRLVYLLRPTWLNKGFDFQINLEGFKSRSNEAPKHQDILDDLAVKKKESVPKFKRFRTLIDLVYGCEEPDHVIAQEGTLAFEAGLPSDTVLKIVKWMFIEQDLTYWNNSGRRMLMNAISQLD